MCVPVSKHFQVTLILIIWWPWPWDCYGKISFGLLQENLKALRARDKAAEKQEEEKLEQVREKILEEGGNPDQILLIQKRINDFQRQKT